MDQDNAILKVDPAAADAEEAEAKKLGMSKKQYRKHIKRQQVQAKKVERGVKSAKAAEEGTAVGELRGAEYTAHRAAVFRKAAESDG